MDPWYDSSVNSNILRKTYVNGFLDVSQNVSARSNLYVNGDTSLNSNLYVDGEIHANDTYRMGGHILPTSNANYDIGSAEYKVRHLFLSDNSLWVGDNHKIDVDEGKLKFRKRDIHKIPKALAERGVTIEQIAGLLESPGLTIENISLGQYLDYAKKSGLDFQGRTGDLVTLEDIYAKDVDDYEDIQDAEITNEDLSLNYKLFVNGDVSFNSKLFVNGDVRFNSRVDVCGNFYAQYPDDSIPISAIIGDNDNKANLDYVDASLNLKADMEATNDAIALKADLTYVDASFNLKADKDYVDASFNLKADINNATFTGKSTFNQIVVNDNLTVTNKTTLGGDVSMNANVDIIGDLAINGNLSVFKNQSTEIINTTVNEYTSIVTEDISLNGGLSVSGDSSFNSHVTIQDLSATNIDAGQISGSSITTQGTVSAQSYNIGSTNVISATKQISCRDIEMKDNAGNITLISYGDTGNTTIQGELSVDTIKETTTNAGVTIESVLLKDGTIDSGGITSSGTISAQSYNIGSTNVISATKQISCRDIEMKDAAGNITLISYGDTGNTTIQGELEVHNDVSFNNGLSVGGDVSFNSTGRVDVCGNFYAQYPENSIPISAIIGDNENKANLDYVDASLNLKADLHSPNLTGTPTAPTAASGTNTTQLATTEFVTDAVSSGGVDPDSDLTLNAGLSVGGDVSMNGNVDIAGSLTVSNGLILGTSLIQSTVTNLLTKLGEDIDGEAAYDESGYSVSLSADGTIVAIGATKNDETGNISGHVRVYQRDTNVTLGWSQLGSDIDGEAAGDESGFSVSLSEDGLTVAIGAHLNIPVTGYSYGHVRVYQYDSNKDTAVTDQESDTFGPVGWNRLGQDIDGDAGWDYLGTSVSLSADGSILAIGAKQDNSGSGYARIYKRDTSVALGWTKLGEDIDAEATGDKSGRSVSLSSDGSIVAIGARYNDGNGNASGHVRVFKYREYTQSDYNAGTYYYQSQIQNSTQTKPLIITENDTTAPVVGNSYWMQLGRDIDGEAAGDYSGYSVSLSSDGLTVAIGAYGNSESGQLSGHVRVYQREYTKTSANDDQASDTFGPVGWNRLGQDIDGEAAMDVSGFSVSLSADGSIVAIGAIYYDNNDRGHVRVYQRDTTVALGWNRLGQDIYGEAAWDESGISVSLSSDGLTVAIGAINNDGTTGTSSDSRGHVRVYQLPSTTNSLVLSDVSLNGTPEAPTAASGTNTMQIANTAFVTTALSTESSRATQAEQTNAANIASNTTAISSKADSDSPTFTGNITIPDKSINITALKNNNNLAETTYKTFVITASSGKYYIDGVLQDTIILYRGLKYGLNVNDSSTDSHPFYIQTTDNGGSYNAANVYNAGVTNNGATTGIIEFIVPDNAPDTLYYRCSAHSGMGGIINIQNYLNINDNLILSKDLQINGIATAPTAASGTNDTQIATTEFVTTALDAKANTASPTFTGTPIAPTAASGTNTTQIANTAFVTTALDAKANTASPTFTGTPIAPTAASGTNTTQIANTEFVTTALDSKANTASPTFTGTPSAPTAASGTNTTQIANTEFVTTALSSVGGGPDLTQDISVNSLTVGTGNWSGGSVTYNTAFGYQALVANTTGNENVASGYQALSSNISGSGNTAIGYRALKDNTNHNNTAIGKQALETNTTGTDNTAIGRFALKSNSGNNNIAIGLSALSSNSGDYNIAIGDEAAHSISGDYNIALGYLVLRHGTTGSNNIGIGYEALLQTTGQRNVAIGYRAGRSNTSTSHNTFIGDGADTTGGYQFSTAIGHNAKITASNQIMLGRSNETVVVPGNMTIVGTTTAPTAASGTNSTQIATTAFVTDALSGGGGGGGGPDLTQDISVNSLTVGKGSGNMGDNTAIGYLALVANTYGNNNTATGSGALRTNTGGYNNTANGYFALNKNLTGGSNVATGANALEKNTTGNYNVATGPSALYSNTTGHSNVALGLQALQNNVNGSYNIAIGHDSLKVNTAGTNTAIGYNTLQKNTTGSTNTAVGSQAGNLITTGSNNTFIGSTANVGSSSTNVLFSTALGYGAQITASNQIVLGRSSETVSIPGTLSKSSGTFKIDHPLPEKQDTHHLVHSFIEGPRMDNIYRGHIHLVNGLAEINLDTQFNMTEGTFVALNRDISVFTTNEDDWDNVRGKVIGNILKIECQNTESTALISYLVIGERQDKHVKESYITDIDGRLITEPLKVRV